MTTQGAAGSSERPSVRVEAELEEIVPEFLENRRRDIGAIAELLDRGDYRAIGRLGHSMKGSGTGYGFDAISELGGRLEQAATDGRPEEIRRLVAELAAYVEQVEVVYV
jgi:HPt (histidine-containing phosphotransfer) domain-containing protein